MNPIKGWVVGSTRQGIDLVACVEGTKVYSRREYAVAEAERKQREKTFMGFAAVPVR